MKKLYFFVIMAVLSALVTVAYAGTSGIIPASRGFSPSTISSASATKGTTTINTANLAAVRYLCTSDCTYKFNGTGSSWLVKANTPETIFLPTGVKSMVFSRTSSATATAIYSQGM